MRETPKSRDTSPADATQEAPQGTVGVALAGASLWLLWVAWPAFHSGHLPLLEVGLSALALVVAVLGMRWLHTRTLLGVAALLVGVPTCLAVAVATRPEAVNQHAFDPVTIVLAALALGLYGMSVLAHGRPLWLRQAGVSIPLTNRPWLAIASRYERGRRAVLVAVMVAGGTAIGVVAPTVGGLDGLRGAWGDAALEGGLLTAVLAGSLGVSIIGLSLPEASRPGQPRVQSGRGLPRAIIFLAFSIVGFLIYLLTTRSG